MKMNKKKPATGLIDFNAQDYNLVSEVEKRSGVNLSKCYHCRTCAGGCPFVQFMDYPPHAIHRLVQMGQRKEALNSSTIWICVGCNTCVVQCPMAIDIPLVMDALRQMALKEKIVSEPGILSFHKLLLDTVKRYGRSHKLEIMGLYKVLNRDFFSDIDIGLKMFLKRKLEILPSRIKNTKDRKKLFK
jgi:heterodisulfide reductase subunit C